MTDLIPWGQDIYALSGSPYNGARRYNPLGTEEGIWEPITTGKD